MVQVERQLVKNIFSSWIGYAVRIIITFFFVPFIASVYGDARYGVWVIIFQTINYFSLLDAGLSSSLVRYVSKYLSQRDFNKINQVLNTSNVLYLVVGSLMFGGIYLFVVLFFEYFKISDPSLIEEGKTALLILGIFMAFNYYLLPFGNSLSAFQRHDLTRLLAIFEEVIRVIIMVWLITNGYGLVSLALVILAMSVVKHVAGALWLKRLHKEIKLSFSLPDKKTARILLGYSRVSFGITAGWLIIFNTDTFLLGMLSASAAAGVYNPGAQLMLYIRNIINAIGIPLTPAISHLEASGESKKIKEIYLKGVKYLSYFSVFLTVSVIIYARPFVELWLPEEFYQSAEVMMILVIGTAVLLPQIIGDSVLFGCEKHVYILYTVILESLAKIILSLVLIPKYGLVGMALANAVPQLFFYSTLYPYFMSRVLRLSYWGILLNSFKSAATAVIIILPAALILRQLITPSNWPALAGSVVIIILIALVPAYFIVEKEDKKKILSFFKGQA